MSHWKTWIQKKDKKQMAATAKDLGIIAAVISVVVLLAYAANGIFPFGEHSIARGDMVQQTIPNGILYVGCAAWKSKSVFYVEFRIGNGYFRSSITEFYIVPAEFIVVFVSAWGIVLLCQYLYLIENDRPCFCDVFLSPQI